MAAMAIISTAERQQSAIGYQQPFPAERDGYASHGPYADSLLLSPPE